MKKLSTVLLFLALGAFLPTASHAIIFFCSDCDCTRPCGLFCTDDGSGARLTCGSTGYCTTGSECRAATAVHLSGVTAPAAPLALPDFLQSLGQNGRTAPAPSGERR